MFGAKYARLAYAVTVYATFKKMGYIEKKCAEAARKPRFYE